MSGFTKIPDETLEALCRSEAPARHLRVILAIARKTLGWGKAADRISASQLASLTGISRGNLANVLSDLVRWEIITSSGGGSGRVPILGIQTDTSRWSLDGTLKARQHGRARQRASRGMQATCIAGDAPTCIPRDSGSRSQPASPAYQPASPAMAEPASQGMHTRDKETLTRERAADRSPAPSEPDPVGPETDLSPLLNLIAKEPGSRREKELWLDAEGSVIESEAELLAESKGCSRSTALRSIVVRFYKAYTRRPKDPDGERKWQREARLEPARAAARAVQERIQKSGPAAELFAEGEEEFAALTATKGEA